MKIASSLLLNGLILVYWNTQALGLDLPLYLFVLILKVLMYHILFEKNLKIERRDIPGAVIISFSGENNRSFDYVVPDHYLLLKISLIAM